MDNNSRYNSPPKRTYGGYKSLISYQTSTIVYDLTVTFCEKFIDKRSRTHDQMVQAARSGRQNIAEGSMAAVTSRKTEIKLVGVARASLEELLQDFLRQRGLALWSKDDQRVKKIRALSYMTNRSHMTYMSYMEAPESAANVTVCLIHQANYLLDRQIQSIEKQFVQEGGYSEQLLKKRLAYRRNR